MKCKNCDNELVGRQKTHCSDRCRMALKRTPKPEQVKVEHETRTEFTTAEKYEVLCIQNREVSLEHYQENPDMYATRANPEKLNWGAYMTTDQLVGAGLYANRVPIPDDWDYAGVCQKVNGVYAF